MSRRDDESIHNPQSTALLTPDATADALSGRDCMVLLFAVAAGGILAWVLAPHWLTELSRTLMGPKPRVFWYLGRSSAFVSYLLLWLSIVVGLMMTSRLARVWPGGPAGFDLHQSFSLMGLLFGIFHAFILMGSRFLDYGILDVLVPFRSDAYRTTWVGLGQLALYGMAMVGLSFYAQRIIKQRAWRMLHFLSFVVFILVLVHGLQAGSDAESMPARALYWFTGGSVFCLTVHRVLESITNRLYRAHSEASLELPAHTAHSMAGTLPVAQPAIPQLAASPVTILFGSQSGNAEALARRTRQVFAQQGISADVLDAARFKPEQLAQVQRLIIISSTHGEGEPPDNIAGFYRQLHTTTASQAHLEYSVLALGDRSYATFCKAGKDLDARLSALGARRLCDLATCDADFEPVYQTWLANVLQAFRPAQSAANPTTQVAAPAQIITNSVAEQVQRDLSRLATVFASVPLNIPAIAPAQGDSGGFTTPAAVAFFLPYTSGAGQIIPAVQTTVPNGMQPAMTVHGDRYSKVRPFPAPIVRTVNLHAGADDSGRETRHLEFSLRGSGFSYEAGDALGVLPANRLSQVVDVLQATGLYRDALVKLPNGGEGHLCDALLRHYDISALTRTHVEYFAEHTGDPTLRQLLDPANAGALKDFLRGRELIDLLHEHPITFKDAGEFVTLLGNLKPRLYSISSSPKMHPDEAHVTVSVVRYESHGRSRFGVCSTDLAHAPVNATKPVFIHMNKTFRLPADANAPVIMVGPGTGIAPFRAFLQERAATGAKGRNWLFFGCQHAHRDFFYREELEDFTARGVLTRLDVAFSRDQTEKIYVQHLMRRHAAELWRWLNDGAFFYVCGDAERMAKDVDAALQDVVVQADGMTADQARTWSEELRTQKRYLRDVY